MSFDYIRKTYGVPAKRGVRVSLKSGAETRYGIITSATNYIHVRFNGTNFSVPVHPTDDGLRYLDQPDP